jgi:very-short-patch-repair endonuclease
MYVLQPALPLKRGRIKRGGWQVPGCDPGRGVQLNMGIFNRFFKKPFKPDYIIPLARDMRKNPTPGERTLWFALKRKSFFGYHFRRQAPFGRYILDFYCAKKKLAIEVDGESHIGKEEYDKMRADFIEACEIKILRFKEEDVFTNLKKVLSDIYNELKETGRE